MYFFFLVIYISERVLREYTGVVRSFRFFTMARRFKFTGWLGFTFIDVLVLSRSVFEFLS